MTTEQAQSIVTLHEWEGESNVKFLLLDDVRQVLARQQDARSGANGPLVKGPMMKLRLWKLVGAGEFWTHVDNLVSVRENR